MSTTAASDGSPRPLSGDELPTIPDDLLERFPELRRVGLLLPLRDYLREVWARREFAVTVPLGELKAQNQDTVLGQLWHLINPILLIAVYFFVFDVVLNVSERGGVGNYLPYLIVGVLTFDYTRSTVQSGARMIVKNRRLVQSINFPRAILPVSAIVSESFSHLYGVAVMLLLLPFIGETVQVTWLLLPVILLVQALFNLGLAMAVARFAFHYRDVQNFMPYVLRLWFYMSGVLYPVTDAFVGNRAVVWILRANPTWSIIEISRDALLGGVAVGWKWALAIGWMVVALLFGFWYFRRAESEYGRV